MTSKTLVDAGFSSVEVLIEQLLGTCQDFSEVGVDFYDLDKEEVECIDDAMFNCASCGWWYDTTDMSEMHEEAVCLNCENTY